MNRPMTRLTRNGFHDQSQMKMDYSTKQSQRPSLQLTIQKSRKLWPLALLLTCLLYGANLSWQSSSADGPIMKPGLLDLALEAIPKPTRLVQFLYWISLPIAMGMAFVFLSWTAIYLDSNVPGQDPPFPIKSTSNCELHLQYAATLFIGGFIVLKMIGDAWETTEIILH
ncbi:hypothetical protein B566_EDAN013195 [Ephemera danica]|nr:hypothetical protein B566_EDAN013195 [Ephemera danica]